jgi:hypothetical protein
LNDGDLIWTQKSNTESGSQLVNLFEFTETSTNNSTFISTTRMGFTFRNVQKFDPKELLTTYASKNQQIYEKFINEFEEFTYDRFGLYFEFLIDLSEIKSFSKMKLFKWISGSKIKIEDYDEISNRYGYIYDRISDTNYKKIILSFAKVLNQLNISQPPKYLLTIDLQHFFPAVVMNNPEDMNLKFNEFILNSYKEFQNFMQELAITEEETI